MNREYAQEEAQKALREDELESLGESLSYSEDWLLDDTKAFHKLIAIGLADVGINPDPELVRATADVIMSHAPTIIHDYYDNILDILSDVAEDDEIDLHRDVEGKKRYE